MARNHNFYFDQSGTPRARGPAAEKTLMNFLETDVQGSDHICRDLMDDLTAVEDRSDDSREFVGNVHRIDITAEGVTITLLEPTESSQPYKVARKHFREVLEDWEAFILDDQLDDSLALDDYL